MRTPNTACLLCGKPLYRRPFELAKARFAACVTHRAEAQKVAGITERQHTGLQLGRQKGTNHRTGYRHRDESKAKVAASNRAYWSAHPEKAMERGSHIRGEKHRLWKGGITKLNKSIRQMTENRRWMDAVKARDGACVRCGSVDRLESHHLRPLALLVAELGVRSRDDARAHAAVLWDIGNGITLCESCHYAEHGRRMAA